MQHNWEPDAAIVVAGEYEQAMSLGYYVRQPNYILNGESTDLACGFRQGDAPDLVMDETQLRDAWNSARRVFLVAYGNRTPADAGVLLERPTYTLVTNRR